MNRWDYIEFKDKFVLTAWLDEPIELGEDNIISKFTFNLPKHLNNGRYQMDWTTERVEQFVDIEFCEFLQISKENPYLCKKRKKNNYG